MKAAKANIANTVSSSSKRQFNLSEIRDDFPILKRDVHGKPLAYLDNAATTQKPKSVIQALKNYYEIENSNVHRGVHHLSEQATSDYEDARSKIRKFINASDDKEIIFVRGTTEGINLVAQTYGRKYISSGDEIVISVMEHHSNIVPWQMLCDELGAVLRVVPINDNGELVLEEYQKLLNPRTKLVSIVHVSNTLGTVNPVDRIIELAHEHEVPVLLDGAQSAPHMTVDVKKLDCDFYTFSGHKMYGPTGIGVLYGKAELLNSMPPYQGGGDMIKSVTLEETLFNSLPYKFEAGTPNIAGVIGFGAAIDYVTQLGFSQILSSEKELLEYGTERINELSGVRLVGTAKKKAGILSFVVDGIHPHDIGTILDAEGVAIRTGHHCTQPLMKRLGIDATARASLAFYNTKEEIDQMVKAMHKAIGLFS